MPPRKTPYRKKTGRKPAKYSRKTSSIVRFGGSKAPRAFQARTRDQQVTYVSTYFEMQHTGALTGTAQPGMSLNIPCFPNLNGMSVGQAANCKIHLGDADETEHDAQHPIGMRKLGMLQQLWHLIRVKSCTVKITMGSKQLENPITFQHDAGDANLISSPLQAVTGAHKSYLGTVSSRTFHSTFKPRTPADWEFHSVIGAGPAADKLNYIKCFQRLEPANSDLGVTAVPATWRVEVTWAVQCKDSRNDMLAAAATAPSGN